MKKIWFCCTLLLSTLIIGETVLAVDMEPKTQKATVNLIENTDPSVSLLEITKASDLNFGSKAIGITDMTLTEEQSPNLVITDIRGDAPGWSLSVSLGKFKDSSNSRVLKGVQLFYPAITLTTNATVDVAERTPETLSTDESFEDSFVKGLRINSSDTPSNKVLIKSVSGKGNGQWTGTYDATHKLELNIPAGNLAGNYESSLTYTLTDGPTI